LARGSQLQFVREEKKKEKKEKKRETSSITIQIFLFFLHESKILIFIKNNLKNTKNILTVRCNSIEFWIFDLIYLTLD